ncbi:HMG box protein [Diaporthe helianthi]|uniref:HMG box protein n=1 Tax=Diaporthe helianthi TaxID=158607 RepID=A0A2P5HTE4_DIAHE|nr:HMG box protein [Diaporthe helianthi]
MPPTAAELEQTQDGIPVLTKPLSELLAAQGFDGIAEAIKIAKKSVEKRRLEAQVDGKVKRPPNSFVLYRSAYLGTLKGLRLHEATTLLAKSWAMECDSVKEAFRNIWKMENLVLAQAFPDSDFGRNKKANMDKSLHPQAFPNFIRNRRLKKTIPVPQERANRKS